MRERESFSYRQNVQLDLENSLIKLPPQKIGWVKFIPHRPIEGEYKCCTVSESCGQWFISIITGMEADEPIHPTGKEVDLGIAKRCALSDGTVFEPLKSHPLSQESLAKLEQRRFRAQPAFTGVRHPEMTGVTTTSAPAKRPPDTHDTGAPRSPTINTPRLGSQESEGPQRPSQPNPRIGVWFSPS